MLKKLTLMQLLMLFPALSRESSQSVVPFWIASRKQKYTEQSDKNGTIKEMKEKDLKKPKKPNKRNDEII